MDEQKVQFQEQLPVEGAPTSDQQKERERKNKWIALLVAGIVGLFLLGLLIWKLWYDEPKTDTDTTTDTTQEQADDQDEDEDSEDTSEDTEDQDETEDVYFDYVWYEDDYIKFMYPEGWEVSVGTDAESDLDYTGDFDGVSEINIRSQQNYGENNVSQYTLGFALYYEGDPIWLEYSNDSPDEVLNRSMGLDTTVNLTQDPFSHELDEIGLTLIGFSDLEITEKGVSILGKYSDNLWTGYSEINPNKDLEFLGDFISGKGTDSDKQSMSLVCYSQTEEDFNACVEFVEKFFSTVERLDGKSETSENPYDGWETYTHDGTGITFMYPESWSVSQRDSGQEDYEITITKDSNYSILLNSPSGHGPEQCVYADQQQISTLYREFDSYTEFSDDENTYRRSYEQDTNSFVICHLGSEVYSDFNGVAYIGYSLPEGGYDETVLDTMDLITLSIE